MLTTVLRFGDHNLTTGRRCSTATIQLSLQQCSSTVVRR